MMLFAALLTQSYPFHTVHRDHQTGWNAETPERSFKNNCKGYRCWRSDRGLKDITFVCVAITLEKSDFFSIRQQQKVNACRMRMGRIQISEALSINSFLLIKRNLPKFV